MFDQPAWLLGFILVVAFVVTLRPAFRRRQRVGGQALQGATGVEASNTHGAPTIEAAELQLALLFQRMRTYLRDPYDYGRSRIKDDAGFEDCLDLAVRLSARVSDLSGIVVAGPAECERIRGQILEGLMARRTFDSMVPGGLR